MPTSIPASTSARRSARPYPAASALRSAIPSGNGAAAAGGGAIKRSRRCGILERALILPLPPAAPARWARTRPASPLASQLGRARLGRLRPLRLAPLRGRRGAGRLPRCTAAAATHPPFEHPGLHARHDERAGRDVARDRRARADVGVVVHRDRRDELRVAADLDAGADDRLALLAGRAVVVAGDGPRADVRVGSDLAVAEVRQMIGLRPGANERLLRLDEVADVDAF